MSDDMTENRWQYIIVEMRPVNWGTGAGKHAPPSRVADIGLDGAASVLAGPSS